MTEPPPLKVTHLKGLRGPNRGRDGTQSTTAPGGDKNLTEPQGTAKAQETSRTTAKQTQTGKQRMETQDPETSRKGSTKKHQGTNQQGEY